MDVYMPKFGKGQVVRLRAFPDVKLQITGVDWLNGVYECICPDGDSYKRESFGEMFIEACPGHELLPPAVNPLAGRLRPDRPEGG